MSADGCVHGMRDDMMGDVILLSAWSSGAHVGLILRGEVVWAYCNHGMALLACSAVLLRGSIRWMDRVHGNALGINTDNNRVELEL